MANEETVSLDAYAMVMAALGAGLPLLRALRLAGVEPSRWDDASEQWAARIDDSAMSDLAILVAFDGALLLAKRRFEPSVEPIASDMHSWVRFRRHFIVAADPVAFLREHELSLQNYARIEADWGNRVLQDDALAAAVQAQLQGPLQECPALTQVAPALLMKHELGDEEPPSVATSGLPATPPPPATAPTSTSAPAMRARRAPSALSGTTAGVAVPSAPVLPFAAGPLDPGSQDDPHLTPAGHARRAELAGTSLGFVAPKGPALPFPEVAATTAPGTSTPVATPATRGNRRPAPDLTGTSLGVPAPTGPALPFGETDTRASPPVAAVLSGRSPAALSAGALGVIAPKAPAISSAGGRRSSGASPWAADVRGTLDGVADNAPVLPFDPRAAPTLPTSEALPTRRSRSPLGGTADATSPPRGSALPFTSPAPLGLSLEQYASLCVELAADPKPEEVLGRYRLTLDQRKALDAHWQGRFKADPSVWIDYDSAYKAYKKWFVASREK